MSLLLGGVLACSGSRLSSEPTTTDAGWDEWAVEAPGVPDGGDGMDGGLVGVDPTIVALPVCGSFAATSPTLPLLTPSPSPATGWGTGSYVFQLIAPTADGWTLALVSGPATPVQTVSDPGNLLAGLGGGDRITVDGAAVCQPYSGCKQYDVIRNAADGTLIEASYRHDSAIDAFSALLGTAVSLEPICRSADADGCFPGALDAQNQLRFAGNPTPIAAGVPGSVVLGGQTVRVEADELLTVSGGDGRAVCLDEGDFFRGLQSFRLAR